MNALNSGFLDDLADVALRSLWLDPLLERDLELEDAAATDFAAIKGTSAHWCILGMALVLVGITSSSIIASIISYSYS